MSPLICPFVLSKLLNNQHLCVGVLTRYCPISNHTVSLKALTDANFALLPALRYVINTTFHAILNRFCQGLSRSADVEAKADFIVQHWCHTQSLYRLVQT